MSPSPTMAGLMPGYSKPHQVIAHHLKPPEWHSWACAQTPGHRQTSVGSVGPAKADRGKGSVLDRAVEISGNIGGNRSPPGAGHHRHSESTPVGQAAGAPTQGAHAGSLWEHLLSTPPSLPAPPRPGHSFTTLYSGEFPRFQGCALPGLTTGSRSEKSPDWECLLVSVV